MSYIPTHWVQRLHSRSIGCTANLLGLQGVQSSTADGPQFLTSRFPRNTQLELYSHKIYETDFFFYIQRHSTGELWRPTDVWDTHISPLDDLSILSFLFELLLTEKPLKLHLVLMSHSGRIRNFRLQAFFFLFIISSAFWYFSNAKTNK